jgi:hypothetical protein
MRAGLIGLGLLACLAGAGCYDKEQQRTQAHEDHLKAVLGITGDVGEPERALARVADVGHAPAAH